LVLAERGEFSEHNSINDEVRSSGGVEMDSISSRASTKYDFKVLKFKLELQRGRCRGQDEKYAAIVAAEVTANLGKHHIQSNAPGGVSC